VHYKFVVGLFASLFEFIPSSNQKVMHYTLQINEFWNLSFEVFYGGDVTS
jgi:cbb3-type cytochrome oxidase subunit 1